MSGATWRAATYLYCIYIVFVLVFLCICVLYFFGMLLVSGATWRAATYLYCIYISSSRATPQCLLSAHRKILKCSTIELDFLALLDVNFPDHLLYLVSHNINL